MKHWGTTSSDRGGGGKSPMARLSWAGGNGIRIFLNCLISGLFASRMFLFKRRENSLPYIGHMQTIRTE